MLLNAQSSLDFGVHDTSAKSFLCLCVNKDMHFKNTFSMEEKLLCINMIFFFLYITLRDTVCACLVL